MIEIAFRKAACCFHCQVYLHTSLSVLFQSFPNKRNDFKCLCSKIFSATNYRCSRLNKRFWVIRSPKYFLSLSILAFKCECNQRNDCLDNSIVLSRILIMISLLCISLFDLKIPSHLSVFTPLECAPNFISTHRFKIYISK